jgi:alanine-synthesizing transaminase
MIEIGMFSSRLRCDFAQNRWTEALEIHRRFGTELFDLTASNPTRANLVYPEHEILSAIADSRGLVYEPDPLGLPVTRELIAQRYGGLVSPDRIVLTASTSEAYSYVFKLLCDPGDEVLVPQPSYPLFDFLASVESIRVKQYPLFYDSGWSIDMAALQDAVSTRSRAVVVVNPNNPTGSFLKKQEYFELAQICAINGLALISDEVFAGYAFDSDEDRVGVLSAHREVLTFSFDGLSKSAALPQMKLGWIAVTGPPSAVQQAMLRLELIADTFLSVGTPVQWAAGRLLTSGDIMRNRILERTRRNLQVLRQTLAGSNLRVLHVEAGWNAIVHAPRTRSEEQWSIGLLQKQSVLVQPGYFYDFRSEPFLVVSLLTPENVFDEGVRRLAIYSGAS